MSADPLYVVHGEGGAVPALADQLARHLRVEPATVGAPDEPTAPELVAGGRRLAELVRREQSAALLLAAGVGSAPDRAGSDRWRTLADRVARHGAAWARFLADTDGVALRCWVLLDRIAAEPDPARVVDSVEQSAYLAFARHLDRDTGPHVRVATVVVDAADVTRAGGLRADELVDGLAGLLAADPVVGHHLVTLGTARLRSLL